MKSNQSFVRQQEAVSPVIGVILMVAITVVLAAVVFVLVSDLGGSNESAPAISFNKNEGTDRIEVVSASGSADWSRLSLRVTSCAGADDQIYVGDVGGDASALAAKAVSGDNCASGANVQLASGVTAILAGDFIDLCSDGADATMAANVVVLITDTVANSKVWEGTFSTVGPCPGADMVLSGLNGVITVDSATGGFDWNGVRMKATACSKAAWALIKMGVDAGPHVNRGPATTGGSYINNWDATVACTDPGWDAPVATSTLIAAAGDTIQLCVDGGHANGVTVQLEQASSGWTSTLNIGNVPACL